MIAAADPALLGAATGKRLLVLDYDGTLAALEVDWEGLRSALSRQATRELGFESTFRPLWGEMARLRDTRGLEAVRALFPVVRRFEHVGVERQRPRPEIVAVARGALADVDGPRLAVFSANLHETVERGLSALGLEGISTVIGADDVERWKPEPEGLRRAMAALGCRPEETVFAGDSDGDRSAAQAAGVAFHRV